MQSLPLGGEGVSSSQASYHSLPRFAQKLTLSAAPPLHTKTHVFVCQGEKNLFRPKRKNSTFSEFLCLHKNERICAYSSATDEGLLCMNCGIPPEMLCISVPPLTRGLCFMNCTYRCMMRFLDRLGMTAYVCHSERSVNVVEESQEIPLHQSPLATASPPRRSLCRQFIKTKNARRRFLFPDHIC